MHRFSPALLSLLLPTAAWAAPVVTVLEPTANQVVSDLTQISATITSPYVFTASAAVQGASTPLQSSGQFWRGAVDTSNLAFGPMTVNVTATDVSGSTTVSVNVVHDRAPVLAVGLAEEVVARPDLRLVATCSDADLYGCATIAAEVVKVNESETAPASLANAAGAALDTTVSLAAYLNKTIRIRFTATDTAGAQAQHTVTVFVDMSPRLHEVAKVPGTLLDFDANHLLFVHGTTITRRTRDGSAADLVVHNARPSSSVTMPSWRAVLTPRGFISSSGELRDGTYTTAPESRYGLASRNGRAVWTAGYADSIGTTTAWMRDTEANTTIQVLSEANSTSRCGLAADGTAAFAWFASSGRALTVLKGDNRHDITPIGQVGDVQTDGTTLLVSIVNPGTHRPEYRIYANDTFTMLTPPATVEMPRLGVDHLLNDAGWIAFTDTFNDKYIVHTRNLDGTIAVATPFADWSTIDAVSSTGELMYFVLPSAAEAYDAVRYLGSAGGGLPIKISDHGMGRSFAVGPEWYVMMGDRLFLVGDPDGGGGSSSGGSSGGGNDSDGGSSDGGSDDSDGSSGGGSGDSDGSSGGGSSSGTLGGDPSSTSSSSGAGGCRASGNESVSWFATLGLGVALVWSRRRAQQSK